MMTMNRTARGVLAGAVLALVAAVVPLTAQEGDPRLDRIRAELPAPAAEQIETRIAEAQAAGLPAEGLLDKAVEGLAKGIPGPRIVGAVDQLAQQLERAQTLLEDGAPPAPTDVAAVADAMRRGVPEPAIRRVAGQAGPDEPVALAVHTMGDLMDRGVPAEQAVAVLEAWRGRGARAEDLRELPEAIERLIRQGVLPGQAAAAVANAMRRGAGQGPGGGQGPGNVMQGTPPIPPGVGPPEGRGRDRGKAPPDHADPPGGG